MKKDQQIYLIQVDTGQCDYCGVCVAVCPENCINLGTHDLEVDHTLCTRCEFCIVVCPVSALSKQENVQFTT